MNAIGKQPVPALDVSWMERAACRGRELGLFFGPDWEQRADREIREARAKQVCAGCPVRPECLEYAFERAKYGVWAGLNEEERAVERTRARRRNSWRRNQAKKGVA